MDVLEEKEEKKEEGGALNEKYKLKCVVIHLGKSVHHGHYVVYIKKNNEWVLYNDEKVTIPESPVLGKGYLYIYEVA